MSLLTLLILKISVYIISGSEWCCHLFFDHVSKHQPKAVIVKQKNEANSHSLEAGSVHQTELLNLENN